MLTTAAFDSLRRREFACLDNSDEVYLDYTGSAIPAASLLAAHQRRLERGVFGNPHSAHAASRRSTIVIEDARAAVLDFFNVDASTHAVCFTANATAAIKLVGESYSFGPDRGLILAADNHNSVNGLREFARQRGARTRYLPLDHELRLDDPIGKLAALAEDAAAGLLAFPAQSNFSGVQHPLALVHFAHAHGLDVLLDAAAFVPSHGLDLRACPADFVAVSFYKMFGYPTGVGALIARRAALAKLSRPWFAGGTVEFVSVQNNVHGLRPGQDAFEDGTPNFLSVGSVPAGLEWLRSIGMDAIAQHVRMLTDAFVRRLRSLRHANGAPLAQIYGSIGLCQRGGTVAFNVLDRFGTALPYEPIECELSERGVLVRGGCFCNPGAAEAAFQFDAAAEAECLSRLRHRFSPARLGECLGDGVAVGALRASFGVSTTSRDLDRAIATISTLRDREPVSAPL